MQRITSNKTVSQFISWIFRRKNPEIIIFKATVSALIGILGFDLIGGLIFSSNQMQFTAIINPGQLIPPLILYSVSIILILSLIVSLIMAYKRFQHEREEYLHKKVIVIEGRGLRDDNGMALVDAIPKSTVGYRQSYLLDLRQKTDGKVINPEDALLKIQAMKIATQQMLQHSEANDVKIVYGGLTSVPYTFLTGIELDDEGKIETFDWDRDQEKWRPLNGLDDNKRFRVIGLESIKDQENIVLAVEVSYPINETDLISTFNWPIVRLSLEQFSSNSHWSKEKQVALADQFLETVKKLSSIGAKKIHLILAAPNSVVFLLGRRFDRRNLPRITVYQYERDNIPTYPWGVQMPVSGKNGAKIVKT